MNHKRQEAKGLSSPSTRLEVFSPYLIKSEREIEHAPGWYQDLGCVPGDCFKRKFEQFNTPVTQSRDLYYEAVRSLRKMKIQTLFHMCKKGSSKFTASRCNSTLSDLYGKIFRSREAEEDLKIITSEVLIPIYGETLFNLKLETIEKSYFWEKKGKNLFQMA